MPAQYLSRTVFIALLLVPFIPVLNSCESSDQHTPSTIRFWHFWSEPAQKSALDSVVRSFKRTHPEVQIILTELSWADGKSKLQLAFNAGTEPDVVHLGLDWFSEFQRSDVFMHLPDSLTIDSQRFIPDKAVARFASMWCVNARALVENSNSEQRFLWGMCATDAHNVMKRMLPLIWLMGAEKFCMPTADQHYKISATMDSVLVNALWSVRELAQAGALIERSRQLDEYLLNGSIRYMFTGSWIIDMARQRKIEFLRVIPQPSIINGDVLAVSNSSKSAAVAKELIAYLTSYEQARDLCAMVSDAGFPSNIERAMSDPLFTSDSLKKGFLETIKLSRPLPLHKNMLSIEPIIEDMIVRCYRVPSRQHIESVVSEVRQRIEEIERQ